jgi:hypothetical protein
MRLTGHRRGATGRLVLVAAIAFLIAASATAALPARAARPGLDTSFGDRGHRYLKLPPTEGVAVFDEERWVTAGDGTTYVLAAGSPRPYGTSGPEYLFRFDADGKLDASFGGVAHHVVFPKRRTILELGVDAHGRVLVTSDEKAGEIRRYTKAGTLDPSFGRAGRVVLPELKGGEVAVKPLPGGGLLAWVESFESGAFDPFHLAKLSEDGRLLHAFGGDGVVNVDVPGEFHVDPVVTKGGAILIGTEGCCNGQPAVTRISARGRLDVHFDTVARRSLRALHGISAEDAEITATLPLRGGGVRLLGGGFGPGFEMRLLADGRPAPGLGRHGVERRALAVEAAVAVGGGEVLATQEIYAGRPGVYLMDASGKLDPRFSRKPILLPKKSYYARPTLVGPGLVAVTYSHSVGCDHCARPFLAHFVLPPRAGR